MNTDLLAAKYGFFSHSGTSKAMFIAPNSPSHKAGLNVNDEIIAVNEIEVKKDNANKWVKYFGEKVQLTIKKDDLIRNIELSPSSKSFFPKVRLILPSGKSNKLYKNWLGE